MDFRGRLNQNSDRPAGTAASRQPAAHETFAGASVPGFGQKPAKLFQVGSLLLLFAVTALVISLTFLLAFNGNKQQNAIAPNKYQAVFLNNGQVYFGKIASVGGKTIDLRNIYYLQTNTSGTAAQASAQSNVSLVKLGCELHAPYDQMLINDDQVIFWENIQDSSQVVTAIKKYNTDNKGKIVCDQSTQNSTQQAPSTSSSSDTTTGTSTGSSSTTTGTGSTTTGTGTTSTTKKP